MTTIVVGAALLTTTVGRADASTPPFAHDSEHTRVWVDFHRDGTFQIDVLGDPVWFLDRLDRLTGLPLSGPLVGEDRDRRMVELERIFSEWVWLFFDGERLKVQAEYLPPDPGNVVNPDWPPLATMRLRGTIPDGATVFSFAYGLVQDDYPIRMEGSDGKPRVVWVKGDLESEDFPIADITAPSRGKVMADYLGLGFVHVLPHGTEQILFVIGLCLLSLSAGALVAQASTLAVAQTLTLGLTAFGILSMRTAIVGPMIALSIAYIAAENLFTSELRPWRLGLVFAFGLLQGVELATGLGRLGLPSSSRTAAAMAFNVGVVAAEVAVIALTVAAIGWLRAREWVRRRTVVPISLAIAGVGVYWTVTRITGG
jgi:hypothetical protein